MAKKIFETKKVNMETLPEYLVAARESFSYDLRRVSKITNISEKFLGALEQGYYHRLPAEVYVYGFLRKLAELYRVDSDLLISQYKKERGIHENLNKSQSPKNENSYKPSVPSKMAFTPKTLTAGLLVLLVVFVVGYIAYQVHAINQPPAMKVFEPSDGSVVHASSVLLSGQTDAGAVLTLDGQPVQIDSSGNFKEPISVAVGPKVLTLTAANSFGKKTTRQISIIGDFQAADKVSAATTAAKIGSFSLTVLVQPNPALITVHIDDRNPIDENFDPGASKTYMASQKIVISTSDAGSTFIRINNGQELKLGKEGQALNDLTFTPDSTGIAGQP